jgi:hypothetical protein
VRSRVRWRWRRGCLRGCLRRRSHPQGFGRSLERDVHVWILGEVPGHTLALPLHLLGLVVPARPVHDVVNDALGEVLQERVHVGHVAQVADVVRDEVAGVAVEYLDGVAWGFTDGHDVLIRITVFMCLCAYSKIFYVTGSLRIPNCDPGAGLCSSRRRRRSYMASGLGGWSRSPNQVLLD